MSVSLCVCDCMHREQNRFLFLSLRLSLCGFASTAIPQYLILRSIEKHEKIFAWNSNVSPAPGSCVVFFMLYRKYYIQCIFVKEPRENLIFSWSMHIFLIFLSSSSFLFFFHISRSHPKSFPHANTDTTRKIIGRIHIPKKAHTKCLNVHKFAQDSSNFSPDACWCMFSVLG